MICKTCGLEKGDEFRKNRPQCKDCHAKRMAEWYVKNKHDVDLKQKEYAKNNKEKKQNYDKDWYKKNKETVLEQSLKYHHEHKEEKSNREKKRYQENRESYLAKRRAKYIPTGNGGPSTGEKKLLEICENFLQQGYIEKYEPQVTHPEVKMKLLCPFDCAIWADNNRLFFVEYHGEQHYKHVNFGGHLTEEQMQDRLIQNKWSDKNKRITCAKLGIPLLVIPYWQQKKMEECLVNFLQFNGVDFE